MWTAWDPGVQYDTLSLLRHIADTIPTRSTRSKVDKSLVGEVLLQGLRLTPFPFLWCA